MSNLLAARVRRFVLRTEQTPLRIVWRLGMAGLTRVAGAYVRAGNPDMVVYARGSTARGEAVFGLSDIDLFAVHRGPADRAARDLRRLRARWSRLCRAIPLLAEAVELSAFDDREFTMLATNPALVGPRGVARVAPVATGHPIGPRTHGLAGARLYGPLRTWHAIAPRTDSRPLPEPTHEHRWLWAWLDMQFQWKHAFWIAANPGLPHAAYFCAKAVYEPAALWLWLATGQLENRRRDALEEVARLLPEEADTIRRARELLVSLPHSPAPPLADTLPSLVRITSRIEAMIDEDVRERPPTSVRLLGAADEPVHPDVDGTGTRLPLADWRARAGIDLADEWFAPEPGDPADPATLARTAAAARDGAYPALRTGRLLILPTALRGTRPLPGAVLRGVQGRWTDPVSFAVADGAEVAAFPDTPGWSAADCAERAVVENAALLSRLDAEPRGPRISRLLSAARAAHFQATLAAGDPELALTAAATARAVGPEAEDAFQSYREWRLDGGPPSRGAERWLRAFVFALPAYRATTRSARAAASASPSAPRP